jgi:hypothetical protein
MSIDRAVMRRPFHGNSRPEMQGADLISFAPGEQAWCSRRQGIGLVQQFCLEGPAASEWSTPRIPIKIKAQPLVESSRSES